MRKDRLEVYWLVVVFRAALVGAAGTIPPDVLGNTIPTQSSP